MADTERPPYEEALALLAAARQREQNLGGLLSILSDPEKTPIPAGTSPISWLASRYAIASPELREDLSHSILTLLRDPTTGEETLIRTLAFVEAAHLKQAVPLIRELVVSRRLVEDADEGSDLHGRALRALFALDALSAEECLECFETELHHDGYVALAFAFVREKAPQYIARSLARIALYPFFLEALRTVLLTYREREGLQILIDAARYSLTEDHARQAFIAALPGLPLAMSELNDLAWILMSQSMGVKDRPPTIVQPRSYAEPNNPRGRSPGNPQRQSLDSLKYVVGVR